jgi:5-methylcytosine-specific restriction endonuclease McrA
MPRGYYLRHSVTEETKRKMSKAKKGNQYWLGKKHTKETKRKMSELHKRENLSLETRKKMSDSLKGKLAWNKGMKYKDNEKYKHIGFQKGNKLYKKKGIHWSLKSEREEIAKKISEANKGKKAWNYIDGRSKTKGWNRYGDDWRKIRERINKRDNYQCQLCGKFDCRLEVHHKIPFGITKDNSDENLITLCCKCHRTVDNLILKEFKNKVGGMNYVASISSI